MGCYTIIGHGRRFLEPLVQKFILPTLCISIGRAHEFILFE